MEVLGFRAVDLGAVALVGLIVLMVLRGQLVTRKQLEDLRADKDLQIAALIDERNTWRAAHGESEEARREAQDQAGELLELSRVATHFFTALPRAAGEVRTNADVDQTPTLPPG